MVSKQDELTGRQAPAGDEADILRSLAGRLLLQSPLRYAAWATIFGVLLQMSGLLWDALLHHRDPTLAENESVFSLTNPSHLMIMIGLASTIVGGVWGIFWYQASRRQGRGSFVSAIVATGLVLALSGTVTGVAIATGGLSGDHDHKNLAGDHHSAGQRISDPKLKAVLTELEGIVRVSGTEKAFGRLDQITASDKQVLSEAHTIVHELGRFTYNFYGSAPVAFSHCPMTYQSGCQHGVLESWFQDNPKVSAQEIVALCDSATSPGATSFVRFQCVHGLGHGVMLFYSHDLPKSLRTCDRLGTDWDRSSCYGGAFMENVVYAQNPPLKIAGHDDRVHKTFLKKEDPLYPCSILEDKYLNQCFLMQTSAILWFNNYNFDKAFTECDKAPDAYKPVCYQSLGRDIAGHTLRDQTKSLRLCALGAGIYNAWCHIGVAKNLVDFFANTGSAFKYCGAVPGSAKLACYFAVGEQIAALTNDKKARGAECAKAPRPFRMVCRRGAQLEAGPA